MDSAEPSHHSDAEDRSPETTPAGIRWSRFGDVRQEIWDRFPDNFRLPITRSHLELATRLQDPIASVLDVGATVRVWEDPVRRRWSGVDYRSCDLDRSNPHDYYGIDQVDRSFDLVMCLEVLEHLEHAAARRLVQGCFEACKPGGYMLASVPNVFTPGIQMEFTHITAIGHGDLGALLRLAGFEVLEIARVYQSNLKRRLIHEVAFGWLHKLVRVDFCQSVAVLARRR